MPDKRRPNVVESRPGSLSVSVLATMRNLQTVSGDPGIYDGYLRPASPKASHQVEYLMC